MMGKKLAFFFALIFAATSATADINTAKQSSGAELVLNGLGAWKSNRRDLFISALYLDKKTTSVDAVLDSAVAKRMEMHFLAKLRPRRFGQMWREFIAINNPKETWASQSVDILRFINLFKDALITGDVIIVDYIPNDKIIVSVNGNLAGEVSNPELIKLLVNAWLGSRPISPQYKQGLLGQASASEQAELESTFKILEPTDGRIAETKNWSKKRGLLDSQIAKLAPTVDSPVLEAAAEEVADTTPVDTPTQSVNSQPDRQAISPPEEKVEEKVAATRAKPVEKEVAVAKDDNQVSSVAENKVDQSGSASKPVETQTQAKQTSQPVTARSEEQVAIIDENVLSVLDEALDGEDASDTDDTEGDEDVSTADVAAQYQVKKDYERSLVRWINQFQKYPVKALRRGMEGEGRLVVVVNRDGEVSNVDMAESTGKRILDRESVNTIKRASPLPKMPDNLTGETFEFSVPIVYKL